VINVLHRFPEAGIESGQREYLLIGIPPFEFGWFRHWINSTIGPGIPAFMRFSQIGNKRLFQQNLISLSLCPVFSPAWFLESGGILGTAYGSPIAFAVAVGGGFSPFGDRESQPCGLMFCGFLGLF
jgi:hypothetical protein